MRKIVRSLKIFLTIIADVSVDYNVFKMMKDYTIESFVNSAAFVYKLCRLI